ncbi:hypothetical protein PtA15_3A831 [Puccinia triticina]|nr:uncharacterized protein PtA15_3A831 [Puccinia triticina]WAQ83460.1 hypothetical protein PtA15_3A831 [Puccinia triticina]
MEERTLRRFRAEEENRLDEEGKAADRATRRATADAARQANADQLAQGKKHRRFTRENKHVGALARKTQRNSQNMAKVNRERQNHAKFAEMRAELARGGK